MKIYNSKAPEHYNFYWWAQDNDKALLDDATSILLYYIQNHGQDNKKRLEVLAEVANKIGFNIKVVGEANKYWFKVLGEGESFMLMLEEIRKIDRGNFESEAVQIYKILVKYRKLPLLLMRLWHKFIKLFIKK